MNEPQKLQEFCLTFSIDKFTNPQNPARKFPLLKIYHTSTRKPLELGNQSQTLSISAKLKWEKQQRFLVIKYHQSEKNS